MPLVSRKKLTNRFFFLTFGWTVGKRLDLDLIYRSAMSSCCLFQKKGTKYSCTAFHLKIAKFRGLLRSLLFFHLRNISKREKDFWPVYRLITCSATGIRYFYVNQPTRKRQKRQNSPSFRNRKITSKWYILGLLPKILT